VEEAKSMLARNGTADQSWTSQGGGGQRNSNVNNEGIIHVGEGSSGTRGGIRGTRMSKEGEKREGRNHQRPAGSVKTQKS